MEPIDSAHPITLPNIVSDFPLLVCNQEGPAENDTGRAPRFLVKRLIGRGSFACVYLMVDRANHNQIVVGKHMVTSHMTEKNRAFAFSEAKNASKFNGHPNVVQFYGSFLSTDWQQRQHDESVPHHHSHHSHDNGKDDEEDRRSSASFLPASKNPNANLLLVFEFADAGDLSVQVRARAPNKHFRDPEVMMILCQIAMALHCLHRQHVMHRDLKTANIFLTSSGLMKLGDFGLSKEYDGTVSLEIGSTFCGTPYYVAPELWNQQRYSNKADVWSLGVVMYELMALRRPFQGVDMSALVRSICSGRPEPLLPECAALYSHATLQLLQAMLAVNPAHRPSVGDIMRTPVMRELGLKQLLLNVPRLGGIPTHVRDSILQDVSRYLDPTGSPNGRQPATPSETVGAEQPSSSPQ
jgi:serine/threonine protein kinase